MSKHTPGPWRLYDDGARYPLVQRGQSGGFEVIDKDIERCRADARLIASAPDLLEAQTMGVELNTPDFLDWIAERLVHVHGENPNVDYVRSLRERAKAGRAAIAKVTGEG